MLEELYELGKFLQQSETQDRGQFIDKTKFSNTKKVVCITLSFSDEKIDYYGIEIEDYDESWANRYLYRSGAPNGPDITPSSIITKPKKTFEKKIIRWFKNNKNIDNFLEKTYNALIENKDRIINDITQKYDTLLKTEKKNTLLTIKFKMGEDKYLNDFPMFKKIFIESPQKRYYTLESIGESKGNGICYFCGKNTEVYGFVLLSFHFSFSTPEKKGFVGGFLPENRWKEIPICHECAEILERGKIFIDQNLSFKFYNLNYYLIPSIILSEKKLEILEKFLCRLDKNKGKEYHDGLVADEDYLSNYVSESGNVLKLIFMFYAKKQANYMDILKVVENVLPTQLKRIFDTQNIVRKNYDENFVKKIFGKNAVNDFVKFDFRNFNENRYESNFNNWYIKFARHIFESNEKLLEEKKESKSRRKRHKEFLNYVSNILSNRKIDKSYIISSFVRSIKKEFRNNRDYEFKIIVIESLMLYDFLIKLDLIGGEIMENNMSEIDTDKEMIEKFFEKRDRAFPNIQAKASFLVGALVNYLLYIQREKGNKDFGDEPFRSKLYGLNLDEKKLKKIFTETVEKLSEYKNYTKLEMYVANYLAAAGEGWTLSKDEISYYFSLGLVLGNILL